MAKRKTAAGIRDRIVELVRVPARELTANPKNWRRHPQHQREALRGLLEEIGFADALLARRDEDGGLVLIDGHLRQEESKPDAELPVLVLDLDEDEADKLLLTLDPLASLAEPDHEAIAALMETVRTESEGVRALLGSLPKLPKVPKDGPVWEPRYAILIECRDGSDQERLYDQLSAAGYECRVLTL